MLIPIVDEQLLSTWRGESRRRHRLVHTQHHVVDVVHDIGLIRAGIADKGELVDGRAWLLGRVELVPQGDDRRCDAVLMDREVVGAAFDIVRGVDDIPPERLGHEQLLRHAVRDLAQIAVERLEPEADAVPAEGKPLGPGQRDIELLERVRDHDREMQVHRSVGSKRNVSLKLRKVSVAAHITNFDGAVPAEMIRPGQTNRSLRVLKDGEGVRARLHGAVVETVLRQDGRRLRARARRRQKREGKRYQRDRYSSSHFRHSRIDASRCAGVPFALKPFVCPV